MFFQVKTSLKNIRPTTQAFLFLFAFGWCVIIAHVLKGNVTLGNATYPFTVKDMKWNFLVMTRRGYPN